MDNADEQFLLHPCYLRFACEEMDEEKFKYVLAIDEFHHVSADAAIGGRNTDIMRKSKHIL